MSAQKTPLSRTLPLFTTAVIEKEIQKRGKALPCQVVSMDSTGTIATVSFQVAGVQWPQVAMPVGMAPYIRLPLQPGDWGVCFPADTDISQASGLGTTQATLTQRANLGALVFFPIGNANASATDNASAVVIYGPQGVIIRDTNTHSEILLNTTEILLTRGSNSVLLNATEAKFTIGGATLTLTSSGLTSSVPITAPDATLAGITFSTHQHAVVGVQTGSSTIDTGVPIP